MKLESDVPAVGQIAFSFAGATRGGLEARQDMFRPRSMQPTISNQHRPRTMNLQIRCPSGSKTLTQAITVSQKHAPSDKYREERHV
jgi:hypothetical protein